MLSDYMLDIWSKKGVTSFLQFDVEGGCSNELQTMFFNANLKLVGDGWSQFPNLLRTVRNKFSKQSWLILLVRIYCMPYFSFKSFHNIFNAIQLDVYPLIHWMLTLRRVENFQEFIYSIIFSTNCIWHDVLLTAAQTSLKWLLVSVALLKQSNNWSILSQKSAVCTAFEGSIPNICYECKYLQLLPFWGLERLN